MLCCRPMATNFLDLEPIVPSTRARRHIDEAINATIARQRGAISAEQLHVVGLDTRAIRRRVKSHKLYEADFAAGIYTATPEPLSAMGRRFGALLWAPRDAGLADTTAGAVLNLEAQRGPLVHVVYTGDVRSRRVPGIKAHPVDKPVPAEDFSISSDGHRCTRTARTILDIAGGKRCTQGRVDDLVDQSVGLELFDLAEFERVLRDRPTHRGHARLEEALRKLDENAGLHRSTFEVMTADLIKTDTSLPTPAVNAKVHGFELDVWFPGTRAVIECDSRRFHRTPAQLAADARKRRVLTHLGFVFLLLRWEQVAYYPEDGLRRIIDHYAANAVPPVAKRGPIPR